MVMIMFVLNDAEKLQSVLDAWEAVGVSGATILHSTGMGRTRQLTALRDDLPLMPSLRDLFDHEEYFSRTLFTIVKDEAMVDKIVRASERVVGDLNEPGNGLIVTIPLGRVFGLDQQS